MIATHTTTLTLTAEDARELLDLLPDTAAIAELDARQILGHHLFPGDVLQLSLVFPIPYAWLEARYTAALAEAQGGE